MVLWCWAGGEDDWFLSRFPSPSIPNTSIPTSTPTSLYPATLSPPAREKMGAAARALVAAWSQISVGEVYWQYCGSFGSEHFGLSQRVRDTVAPKLITFPILIV